MENDRARRWRRPSSSATGCRGPDEVVLGAATMAQLHKHLGQDVTVSFGAPADAPVYIPPTRLRIVGTATFPAIGFASTVSDHTSMGTGRCSSRSRMLPQGVRRRHRQRARPCARRARTWSWSGSDPGVPPAAALASLDRIVAAADRAFAAAARRFCRQRHRRAGGPAPG